MSSRDVILSRVRRALADVTAGGDRYEEYEEEVERGYLREHGDRSTEETVGLLAENLADYRALVHRCTPEELPGLLGRLLAERGSSSVLAPPGLPAEWLAGTDAALVPDRTGALRRSWTGSAVW